MFICCRTSLQCALQSARCGDKPRRQGARIRTNWLTGRVSFAPATNAFVMVDTKLLFQELAFVRKTAEFPDVTSVAADVYPIKGAKLTKGARTRRLLMDTALEMLNEAGYHDLKVTDVARRAGLSTGVFYIYFKDKTALVIDVFNELLSAGLNIIFEERTPEDPFLAILQTNRRYISLLTQQNGTNRAIFQILDQLPEAREVWQKSNSKVARRIAAGIERRTPGAIAGEEARIFSAYAAQAMLDTVLLNAVSFRDPDVRIIADDIERFAEAISVLWYRMLYGKSPPAAFCPLAADFLAVPD
jgi:AcrR family transcriptional regulator